MISERIKEAREMTGMSTRQAVRFSNHQVNEEDLVQIETGKRKPTRRELEVLAKTYEIRIDWLRGNEKAQKTVPSVNARGLDGLCSDDVATLVRQVQAYHGS